VASTDCWADWIRTRRSGGDADFEAEIVERLAAVRERVLDNAYFDADDVLLDVGCGNGLIAFGALERGARRVVFADVSEALLDDCRELAADAGLADRCEFVRASAEDLSALDDESVDVVTTRSVLIYVADKEAAFREFHRVLRPQGRISLFEPINRFGSSERRCAFGFDVAGAEDLMAKVRAVFDEIQPDSDPMVDFDERDLLAAAERAGFFPLHLDYRADVEPFQPRNWQTVLHSSGNPKIPTLDEAMADALTPEERAELTAVLRPAVEQGRGTSRSATAYLWAVKP
jgi:arsenite methyltransferase